MTSNTDNNKRAVGDVIRACDSRISIRVLSKNSKALQSLAVLVGRISEVVLDFIKQQKMVFYQKGIFNLVKQWCDAEGDFTGPVYQI